MASQIHPETLIVIKALFEGVTRRFMLPLKELGAQSFPQQIHQFLNIPDDSELLIERYSDSSAKWVLLDSENPSIYKQLYRAARAKLKLRIKVTEFKKPSRSQDGFPWSEFRENDAVTEATASSSDTHATRGSYLNTVLNYPLSTATAESQANLANSIRAIQSESISKDSTLEHRSSSSNPPHVTGAVTLPTRHVDDDSAPPFTFYIDCNNCGSSIPNTHWHCGTCERGDYDLCLSCIESGVRCPEENHWLIKRYVTKRGVMSSITEKLAPKSNLSPKAPERDVDEVSRCTLKEEPKVEPYPHDDEMRTCNACFRDFRALSLVTCADCTDYDLCLTCMISQKHGHHPGHTFFFTQDIGLSSFREKVKRYCRPGRDVSHHAICDGCNQRIHGVRNKCLECPDFDYCFSCIHGAITSHPGHRFVPIYDPIATAAGHAETHYGIYCDGPLCSSKNGPDHYITGVRYKCAICHDTDFCASCEAHPSNTHNQTHPLVKFKTAVRHVSISTIGENENGLPLQKMGDHQEPTIQDPAPVSVCHVATQVLKAGDFPSTAPSSPLLFSTKNEKKRSPARDLASAGLLQAEFVQDTVADGSEMAPGAIFTQKWVLRNPGPAIWPQGSSVRFAGGDTMFNIDTNHPTSTSELISAMESTTLMKPVPPFESAEFSLNLKTPHRLGRAISYWRLKTPDGAPFGDRLWCDVLVRPETELKPTGIFAESATETVPCEGTVQTKLEPTLEKGDMVFPKLEKESPESSITFASGDATVDAMQSDELDLVDDVESLTLANSDGFSTDEEYDILDASDEELISAAQKQEQHQA
ncbi:hypothetical protein LOZ51_002489 [Ophidiomyces ophidiicola]|nr:hypothetical protein LOZ55_004810 [Ophidiomyces ophidiicola]KAI1995189.1 hypothetical protein LOZ54_000688 [Ophidiomyces ophidiicola]KAI1998752.1 hypothetical protein LOZ51_002489 [Ophidiomyces ophidiicola]